MANSWYRVAQGLRKVSEAAVRQGASDGTVVATRTVQHLTELAVRAADSLSTEPFTNAPLSNPSPISNKVPPSSSFDSVSATSTNPSHDDASQLAKPMESAAASNNVSAPLAETSIPAPPPKTIRKTHIEIASRDATGSMQSGRSVGSAVAPSIGAFLDSDASPPVSSSPPPVPSNAAASEAASPQPIRNIDSNKQNDPVRHIQEGRPVPSTRLGRAVGFAQLGAGLAAGTLWEGASRLLGGSSTTTGSWVANDTNSDLLAANLCRMRGAALKMGQMLSIQDESLLPPALSRALQQVRQGAEAMPSYQLQGQLESQLGANWRKKFVEFDMLPFAAASIGQVHRASIRTKSGQEKQVVVKVQYPGVGESIESDLRNLSMLVKWSGFAPKGLFIENVIRVGRDELKVECDYIREMKNQQRIRELVEGDPVLVDNQFHVPRVMEELTTDQILTSEYLSGGTVDKVADSASQEEKNRIGRAILYLTMKELFDWRFMQTDPNWGNFLYDVGTKQTGLIDFGAAREYSKDFVDGYLRIVWASANKDESTLMEQSHRMGFLTGDENEQMQRAHVLSGFTVGEPFHEDAPFDFLGSSISERMGEHTSVFLRHRLTPPPEEVYTLHRKLAGAYMLCIKLGAIVQARNMLRDIVVNHTFEDGLAPPNTY